MSSEVLVGNRLMETWGDGQVLGEKRRVWASLQIRCANLCALVRLVCWAIRWDSLMDVPFTTAKKHMAQ